MSLSALQPAREVKWPDITTVLTGRKCAGKTCVSPPGGGWGGGDVKVSLSRNHPAVINEKWGSRKRARKNARPHLGRLGH